MYRTSINKLLKWKLSKDRKPLIVQGARQVGKTWLIKEFGKTEFKGALTEQFVMQQLRAADIDYIGYWTNDRSTAETAIRTSLSDYRKESWMTNVPLYIIGSCF